MILGFGRNMPLGVFQHGRGLFSSRNILRQFIPPRWYWVRLFIFILALPALYYIYYRNALCYLFSLPFYFFQYPLEVDMPRVVNDVLNGRSPGVEPLNTDKYPITMDNDRLCRTYDGEEEEIFLLYLIKSKMDNFKQRDMIRQTWAQENLLPGVPMRRVFLLGMAPGNIQLQSQVAQEHEQYGDLVQGYFVDQYYNNTLKLMMGFHWATSRCRGAKFLAFMDDDFFLSPFNLVRHLKMVSDSELGAYISGYTWQYGLPNRWSTSKWYISLREYPYLFWPPYPAAGSFFVSQVTAQKIFAAMHYIKQIRFDDVFVGIATWKLKIPVRNIEDIYFHEQDVPRVMKRHGDVISAQGFKDVTRLRTLWDDHYSFMMRLGRAR